MADSTESNIANLTLTAAPNQFFPGTLCNDLVIYHGNASNQIVFGSMNASNSVIIGPTQTTFAGPIMANNATFTNITGTLTGNASTASNLVGSPAITASTVTATTFTGALVGNATTASSCTGNAATASNLVGTPAITASTVTATTFTGALVGNATTATSALTATSASNLVGSPAITASTVTATTFTGALVGNASTATNFTGVPNITVATITSSTHSNTGTFSNSGAIYATTVNATTFTGNAATATTANNLTGVPAISVNTIAASGLVTANAGLTTTTINASGAITGNLTGNALTATNLAAGTPNITVGNITSTGTHSNNGPIYATTVTATTFTGALVGNATTCTGNSATATNFAGTPAISVNTIAASGLVSANAGISTTTINASGAITGNLTGTATNLSGAPNVTVTALTTTNLTATGTISFPTGSISSTSIAGGGSGQWTTTTSNVYILNSNVGIGTSNCLSTLNINNSLTVYCNSNVGYQPFLSDSGLTQINANTSVVAGQSYGNGTYIISASSYNNQPYQAFSPNLGSSTPPCFSTGNFYNNSSGAYTGSTYTQDNKSNKWYGEWLQIKLPQAITLTKFYLKSYPYYVANEIYLLGSSDGNSWTNLGIFNTNSKYMGSAYPDINTFSVSNTQSFNYYRVVINSGYLAGSTGTSVTIAYLMLYSPVSITSIPSLVVNQAGFVGIGVTSPFYQLDLSSDAARKLTTTTWTTGSDRRVKNNIEDADLPTCYNNIKQLKLRKFEWNSDIYTNVQDRKMLGWIAQEVQPILPKSITQTDSFGISDFNNLDTDQIIKSMYGALQQTIRIVEQQNEVIQQYGIALSNTAYSNIIIPSLPVE